MFRKLSIILALSITALSMGCNFQTDESSWDGTTWGVGSFDSNGKRIYFTATTERGTPISYTGGPAVGMMMMGGRLACVSCHGIDARGGEHVMHMEVMTTPDIRWSALSGEDHDEQEPADEHPHETYDFGTFRTAVEGGKHPDGKPLDKDMPRWRMRDDDMRDLMDYLQSL